MRKNVWKQKVKNKANHALFLAKFLLETDISGENSSDKNENS